MFAEKPSIKKGLGRMLALLMLVSVLNFALGFAFALWWEYCAAPPGALQPAISAMTEAPADSPQAAALASSEQTDAPPAPLPEAEGSSPKSEPVSVSEEAKGFVEASEKLFQLPIADYLDEIIDIEQQLYRALDVAEELALPPIIERLHKVNDTWLRSQSEAFGGLMVGRDELGPFEQVSAKFEEILLEQTARIETATNELDELSDEDNPREAVETLRRHALLLASPAFRLRDCLHEAAALGVRLLRRFDDVAPECKTDPSTGVLNRTGLEEAFERLCREGNDPRVAAVFDLDHCVELNRQCGLDGANQIIAELGEFIQDELKAFAPDAVVARTGGQAFLALLQGRPIEEASLNLDHLRQLIDNAQFGERGEDQGASVKTGVLEFRQDEPLESISQQLADLIDTVRGSGGNQCWTLHNDEARRVAPASFEDGESPWEVG